MKPRIRKIGEVWACGESLIPCMGVGPPCGDTPAAAYAMWKSIPTKPPIQFYYGGRATTHPDLIGQRWTNGR